MIFGKQSDVKKHLSSKHKTFSHRVFVDDEPREIAGQGQAKEQSPEQTLPAKLEKPDDAPAKT